MKKILLALMLALMPLQSFAAMEINESNFEQEVMGAARLGQVVVIKFYATWCGPCKIYQKAFDAVAKQMPEVLFVQIDVDKNPSLSAQIDSVPTTFIIKGDQAAIISGAISEKDLKELINKVIKGEIQDEPTK